MRIQRNTGHAKISYYRPKGPPVPAPQQRALFLAVIHFVRGYLRPLSPNKHDYKHKISFFFVFLIIFFGNGYRIPVVHFCEQVKHVVKYSNESPTSPKRRGEFAATFLGNGNRDILQSFKHLPQNHLLLHRANLSSYRLVTANLSFVSRILLLHRPIVPIPFPIDTTD